MPEATPRSGTASSPVTGPASYFPSIERTYGQPVQHWLDLVDARPADEKHGATVAWLKAEHGLGHGHANALVAYARARRGAGAD
ncbi:DUF4287 domain-containing protein [Cellulomonas sp. DKR-3]|uniref:DUF4287 domain-containing protein n=1 Tax=Cellulomonas fulva TaxID=2835530 RepID=A0ABS5TZC5_9CELL|nr:DUF4287 domain-containing protein [Cellulomonas fulva]MBT0994376.1 DUF4287 domain-containing protein [Cellulomonas fulva]